MLYAYIILIKIKYSSHLLYCMLVSLPYTCDLCAEKSTDDTVIKYYLLSMQFTLC